MSTPNVINQNKKDEWSAHKSNKTAEFAHFRGSAAYDHEFKNLVEGLSALHPQFVTECATVVGDSVAQVAAGTPVDELDRATKTNIGPAIERKFLERFGLPQLEATEKIDTRIGGVLIDIKTTIRDNWMIHVSCIGKWCLLFSEDCNNRTFNLGIVFITADMLSAPNGDWKSSISKEGKQQIHWIIRDEPFRESYSELCQVRQELVSIKDAMRNLTEVVMRAIEGKAVHA